KRQQQLDDRLTKDTAEIRAVFGALAHPLLVLDSARRLRLCNSAFEQLISQPAPAGTPLLDLTREAALIETIDACFASSEPVNTEVTLLDKTYELTATPISDDLKQVTGATAIFHDVSRLKQTDQIRRDFVANVSHELRTPLSIFRGNIETLLEDQQLSTTERQQILATVRRHSDRLTRIVEDLLTLTRLESKAASLQLAPLDVVSLLKRIVRDWSKRIANRNLHLDLRTDGDLPLLQADEFRIEQVMNNLLDNAVNYSPDGGEILISANGHNDKIELTISDHGPGISPEDLPRIFERFYRADKARSRALGSTGLGLSIVKHIVHLHGGEVWAESELGKGTRIRLQFRLQG
ncbi:MAG: PAS domain-containing protein, partial [Verrucomicrobia bacterium]|nr:PAS domain-containing protein [Verrucomicrobiota bacterium]